MISLKKFFFITLVILLSMTLGSNAQISQTSVFKVKLRESDEHILSNLSLDPQSNQIMSSNPVLNGLLSKYGVKEVTRLFPHAGKFEEKHRKHGLHLWYKVKIDSESLSLLERCIQDFKGKSFVQISEPFIEYDLNDIKKESDSSSNAVKVVTDDPYFQNQWHYHNTGQTGGAPGADIKLLDAWDLQMGSSDVIVAIIDGGLDPQHEDLEEAMWLNDAEYNGTTGFDDDNNGYIDDIYGFDFVSNTGTISPHYHGVHVGGTVGAVNNNGIGVSGIAGGSGSGDGVRLMSCQVFSGSGSGGMENAYVYAADNGAVISQNSWGYVSPGYYEQAVLDAIDYFIDEAGYDENGDPYGPMQGGIVIFAAGNDSSDDDYYPGYYSNVMAVASLDHNDTRSYFSNYGSWVDIAAPGSSVYSTYLNNGYDHLSGTSMACPHVSGVAALIVSQFPGIELDDVWARLTDFSDNVDSLNLNYAGKLGSGRVNALMSLTDPDTIAPAAITDLQVEYLYNDKVTLSWTSSGASGNEGRASFYDIRISNALIDSANFKNADPIAGPIPRQAGEKVEFTIDSLSDLTTYYLALKAGDYYGNISPISNVISFTTPNPPEIRVEPLGFYDTLYTGGTKTNILKIYNDGESALDIYIESEEINTSALTDSEKINFHFKGGDFSFIDPENNKKHEVHSEPLNIELSDLTGLEIAIHLSESDYPDFINDLRNRGANVTWINNMDNIDSYDIFFADDNISDISSSGISDINEWINNGGGVFLVADESISDANDILEGAGIELYSSSFNFEELTNIYSHPTTDSVSHITSSSHGAYLNLSGVAQIIAKENGGEIAIAASELGSGKVMVVGNEFNFGSYYFEADNRRFSHQTIDWLSGKQNWFSINTESGTITSGDSLLVEINIDAAGLSGGDYQRNLNIFSNDPVNDHVVAEQHLHIYPAPDISLEKDTVDFGKVFAGYPYYSQVEISNAGLDSLFISQISSNNTAFTPDTTQLALAPNGKYVLEIEILTASSGNIVDTLYITSNDPDEPVYPVTLMAEVLLPPVIKVTPDSLSSALVTGGTDTQYLTVDNTDGNSDLYVSYTSGSKTSSSSIEENLDKLKDKITKAFISSDKKALVEPENRAVDLSVPFIFKKGNVKSNTALPNVAVLAADSYSYANDVVNKLVGTGYFNTVTYLNVSGFTPSLVDLELFDGVLVYRNSSYYNNTALGNVLADYYDNGGGVVTCFFDVAGSISYSLAGRWDDDSYYIMEKKSGSVYDPSSLGEILVPSHPILTNVDEFDGGDYSFRPASSDVSMGGEVIAKWEDDTPLVLTKEKNGRNLVELSFFPPSSDIESLFWDATTDGDLLMGNALLYAIEGGTSWLRFGQQADTIQAGNTKQLEVLFDASGLRGGDYHAYINVNSNDPAQPLLKVPAYLDVTGAPDLVLPKDSLYYENVYVTDSKTDSLLLRNMGYDTLYIEKFEFSDAVFSIQDSINFVPPRQSSYIYITFAPEEEKVYESSLSIFSNDYYENEITVKLNGTGILPPVFEVDRDSLFIYSAPGEVHSTNFDISNEGDSEMSWEIVYPYVNADTVIKDFDYYWIDSDAPNGPEFEWEDIRTSGTSISLGDDAYQAVSLPFDFEFYGEKVRVAYISSNGLIGFDSYGVARYSNTYIPSTYTPDFFLAAFWDDLHTYSGSIYYKDEEDRFIVQYDNISNNTFQVILFANGDIKYQYLDLQGYTRSATVGIENKDGTEGLQIIYNDTYLKNNLAILIRDRNKNNFIKSIQPINGLTKAGESQTISVEVNTEDLEYDTQHDDLIIFRTNDPHAEVFELPVKLFVINPPEFEKPDIGVAEVKEGGLFSYDFNLLHENSYAEIDFTLSKDIDNMTIDSHGLLVFEPNFEQAGFYNLYVKTMVHGYQDSVLVSFNVLDVNRAPQVSSPIENQEYFIDGNTNTFSLNDHIVDPDGDQLVFIATCSNPNAVSVYVDGQDVFILPKLEEIVTITVTANDDEGKSVIDQFLVTSTRLNNAPEVLKIMEDVELMMDSKEVVYNLAEYFTDQDEDPLTFAMVVNDDEVVESSILGTVLKFKAKTLGDTDVSIEASDPKGELAEMKFKVRVAQVTSLEEINDFRLFPNPSEGVINVSFDRNENYTQLMIVNELGEVLLLRDIKDNLVNEEIEIDLSGHPSGIYFMLVQTDENLIREKFIIR